MPEIGVNFPEHIVEITPSVSLIDVVPNIEDNDYSVIIALINNNKAIPNRTFLAAAFELEKELAIIKQHQRRIIAYKLIGATIWIPCGLLIGILILGFPIMGLIVLMLILASPFLIGLYVILVVILYGIIVVLGLERPFPFDVKNLINCYYFSGFNIKNNQNEDITSLLNTDNCIKITKFQLKNVKYMYEKKYNNKIHKISKHFPYNFTNNIEYQDITYVYYEDNYYLVVGVFKNTIIQRILSITEIQVL
jgi:hypothetical protein